MPLKTAEMDDSDIELSKKSKIIEIGSVEKKLRLFKVGEISEIFGNPGFSYSKIQICLPKLFRLIEFLQKSQKSFFESSLSVLKLWI